MLNIKRVVAAVSGGVDSAVAALFLKKKGYDVIGVFMENWDIVDERGSCSASQDAEDAEWVCRILGIPFHHVNFVKEYWNDVFWFSNQLKVFSEAPAFQEIGYIFTGDDSFLRTYINHEIVTEACNDLVKDYERGYTPNPDILCNRRIKFDSFYNYAREKLEACAIATGHYARTSFGDYLENYNASEGVHLLKAVDLFKDQTFFLSQVPQLSLQKSMFPLGKLTKKEVKRIACEFNLEYLVFKKESTGICFIGSRNFQNFISEYVVEKPGSFRDIDSGQIVGTHTGVHQWTIGQRSRIGGQPKPYFVARKDLKTNDIYVALGTEHPSLFTRFLITSKPHWIHSVPQPLLYREVFKCEFRFQHTKPLVKCDVVNISGDQLLVLLDVPLRAVTLGQYAVFYKGEECMGSARIIELGPSLQNLGFQAQEDILTRNSICL